MTGLIICAQPRKKNPLLSPDIDHDTVRSREQIDTLTFWVANAWVFVAEAACKIEVIIRAKDVLSGLHRGIREILRRSQHVDCSDSCRLELT
jgi:hypothetical protein